MRDYASNGQVFRLEPGGTLTNMHSFTGGPDGAGPVAPLAEAADGSSTAPPTREDSATQAWCIGSYPLPERRPSPSSFRPRGEPPGGASVRVIGTHFQPGASAAFGGLAFPVALDADSRTVIALAPALAPGSISDAAVTNTDATTSTLAKAWFADFLDVDSPISSTTSSKRSSRAGITAGCGSGNYCRERGSHARADGRVPPEGQARRRPRSPAGHRHRFPRRARAPSRPTGSRSSPAWASRAAAAAATTARPTPVTRAQMAVFLLKTSLGSGYVPPVVARIFERRRARRLRRRLDRRPLRPRHHRRLHARLRCSTAPPTRTRADRWPFS